MIGRGTILAAAAAALFAAAATPIPSYVTPEGRFRVVGYNDMEEMLAAAATRIAASGSPIRYQFELKSTRSAPAALISGASLLAPMGAEMERADRAEFRSAWSSDPIEFRVAHDSLVPGALSSPTAILVAWDNPLKRISLTQIRQIFVGGTIVRWGDLGLRGVWAKRPIHAVSLASDTAIGKIALAGSLHGKAFASSVEGKRQSRDVAGEVANDLAAMGLAKANFSGPAVRALPIVDDRGSVIAPTPAGIRSGRYPFDRFLLIYARRESGGRIAPAARTLLESLLSPAGQRAIGLEGRGYLPLNPRELAVERAKLIKIS